jgi:hypothetical protein
MLKKHDAIFILLVVLSLSIPIMVGLLTVADSVRDLSDKFDFDLENVTQAMVGIEDKIGTLTSLFNLIDFNLLQTILLKVNETLSNNRTIIIKILYNENNTITNI